MQISSAQTRQHIGRHPVLMDHQQQELEFLRSHRRALLLSEAGTGKTPTLLSLASEVMDANGTVLWLTSKSLVNQLKGEAKVWLPEGQQPVSVDAKKPSRFLVTTHDTARNRPDLSTRGRFDLVIVDEASKVGGGGVNPRMPTYLMIRDICHAAGSSVLATAEPLNSTHALDLWALADVAGLPGLPTRADMNQMVKWAEFDRYGYVKRQPDRISAKGFRLLTRSIQPYQHRTRLDSVADLPEVDRFLYPVPLTGKAAVTYQIALAESGLIGHHARTAASRDPRVLVPKVIDLLQSDYSRHSSVVIFSDWFDVIDPLVNALDSAGITYDQVNGTKSARQRNEAVAGHRSGRVRVLVMTAAGEFGLNLQHSNLLITVVETYSPAREVQRVARIRRVGSQYDRLTHAVVFPDVSLERRKTKRRGSKEALIEQMWEAFK